jgi:hypothetical protein
LAIASLLAQKSYSSNNSSAREAFDLPKTNYSLPISWGTTDFSKSSEIIPALLPLSCRGEGAQDDGNGSF